MFKSVAAYQEYQDAKKEERDANYGSRDSQIDLKDDALLAEAGFILVDLANALDKKAVAIQTPLKQKVAN